MFVIEPLTFTQVPIHVLTSQLLRYGILEVATTRISFRVDVAVSARKMGENAHVRQRIGSEASLLIVKG